MIPSTWYRRLVLVLFVLGVGTFLMWLASQVVSNPADRSFAQTAAGLVLLLGFYASSPLAARFLAPHPSRDQAMQARLSRVAASVPDARPVFLYDHKVQSATTVGIVAAHSRVYVTSGLMNGLSDEGLRAVLAHEGTHVREHHILVSFAYANVYALLANVFGSSGFFLVGFVAFMTLRRYLEYRADAGGAIVAGRETMLRGLHELHLMYPTLRCARFFNFAAPYPTMPMRIKAIETGARPLL